MESYTCPECGTPITVLPDSEYGNCALCGRSYKIDRDAEVVNGDWVDRTQLYPVSLVVFTSCGGCGAFLGVHPGGCFYGNLSGCCDSCYAKLFESYKEALA